MKTKTTRDPSVLSTLIYGCLLLLCLFVASIVQADSIDHIRETGVLQICANPEQKPISWREEQPKGFQIELAQLIANQINTELEVSWIYLKRRAKTTGCDLYAGVATLDGDTRYVKKSDPFMRMEFVLVTSADKAPIHSIDDLKGLTVGVPAGSLAAHQLSEREIKLAVSYIDEASRLDAVAKGLIDAAIVTRISEGWYRHQFPTAMRSYDAEQLLDSDLNYNYSLGLRRANPKTKAAFNRVLRNMKEDGSLSRLLQKYGVSG